jgi:TolB-like protein
MSQSEGQTEGNSTQRRIIFGRFVLDLARGALMTDGREIPLRPPTLGVLACLAERSGQWVAAEEIFEAVWPGQTGLNDQLMQSVGELRRVLGDAEGKLVMFDADLGAMLQTAAAAPERRNASGVRPLRFRWMYGLIAPIVLALAFTAIWLATPRHSPVPEANPIPAVAVLPFQDQSDDPALAPRAERLTRDLIAALARNPMLVVKSWEEVAVYKGALAQPGEVARVLAVTFHVEGSVRHAEGQVRVSAQLVDLKGEVLWSVRLVELETNAAALPERMAREIGDALAEVP